MPYSPYLRTSLVSLVLIFLYSSCQLLAHAKTVSRIIDDTYGDEATGYLPVYFPHDSWVWKHNCNTEQGCLIVPDDQNRIQNKTWTAATYRPNMSDMGLALQFEGTAISVYFILANDIGKDPVARNTECNFILDGNSSHQFTHEPTYEKGFDYNYEAYSATALENKQHKLEIMTGDLDHPVYISFDYARYITEIPDDSNSTTGNTVTAAEKKKRSVGVIVGAVFGGVGLLCVVALILVLRKRRYRFLSHPHHRIPELYPHNQPPETNQVDSDAQSTLREQIRHMQVQLDSLQNQSRVQSSEPPPSYPTSPSDLLPPATSTTRIGR